MISQQIAHIKNIIVFKIMICILCGSFIAWRLPAGNDELANSLQNLRSANAELGNIENKVKFTKESKNIIDSTYKAYSDALQIPYNVSCIERENVESKLIDLGKSFRLQTDPVITESQTPVIAKFNESRFVQILSTNFTLEYPGQSFKHAIAYAMQAYSLLPVYSKLESMDIDEKDIITPSTFGQLAINIEPQLIYAVLNVKTREIKASKDQNY